MPHSRSICICVYLSSLGGGLHGGHEARLIILRLLGGLLRRGVPIAGLVGDADRLAVVGACLRGRGLAARRQVEHQLARGGDVEVRGEDGGVQGNLELDGKNTLTPWKCNCASSLVRHFIGPSRVSKLGNILPFRS